MAKKIAESPAELAWNGITGGVVHELPEDLGAALADDAEVLALWESLTPLGRNEFICWVSDAKKARDAGAPHPSHARGTGRGEAAALLLAGLQAPIGRTAPTMLLG